MADVVRRRVRRRGSDEPEVTNMVNENVVEVEPEEVEPEEESPLVTPKDLLALAEEPEIQAEVGPVNSTDIPARRRIVRNTPAEGVSAEPVNVPAKLPEPVDIDGSFSLVSLLKALPEGKAITIQHMRGDLFRVADAAEAAAQVLPVKASGNGRLPNGFWDFVYDPAYKVWHAKWSEMTYEEKVAYAKKAKITWESHEAERTDHMRVTLAVMEAEKVEKFKEPYRDDQARRAKDLARAGYPEPYLDNPDEWKGKY